MNELVNLVLQGKFETALVILKNSKLRFYDLMCKLLYIGEIDKLKHFTYFLVASRYLGEDKNGK